MKKVFAIFIDCFITAKIFCDDLLSSVPSIGSVTGSRKVFQGNVFSGG